MGLELTNHKPSLCTILLCQTVVLTCWIPLLCLHRSMDHTLLLLCTFTRKLRHILQSSYRIWLNRLGWARSTNFSHRRCYSPEIYGYASASTTVIINQAQETKAAAARPVNDDHASAYFFFGFVAGCFLGWIGVLFMVCKCNRIVGNRESAFLWRIATGVMTQFIAIVALSLLFWCG